MADLITGRDALTDRETMSEEDRLIHVTSFFRTDGLVQVFGNDLDAKIPEPNAMYQLRHHAFPTARAKGHPTTGLGTLDRFPTEIMGNILSQLTVRATMRFRGVNRRAKQLVNSMIEYKAVTTHAVACFQSVFCLKIAETLRFADLYRAMCIPHCELCRSAGDLIYLPTLTRCCLRCLTFDPNLRAVSVVSFGNENKTNLRTSCQALQTLRKHVRTVLTIPWDLERANYADREVRFSKRTNYVDQNEAKDVLRKLYGTTIKSGGSTATNGAWVALAAAQSGHHFAAHFTALPASTAVPLHVSHPAEGSYLVSCPLPLFDKATGTSYYSLSCKGCALEGPWRRILSMRNREYTRQEFLLHARGCKAAQRLWRNSEQGRKDISHMDNDVIRNHGRVHQ